MLPLVQIKNLQISFPQNDAIVQAVKNISFNINKGSITAIIGESGSGKSLTALSLLKLLPNNAITTGQILFNQKENYTQNIAELNTNEIKKIRGNEISMIFQEPMTSLNPLQTCGKQVMEILMLHKKISKAQAKAETIALFEKVELPNPQQIIDRYPHQISGGQKQRVMIAMAMSCKPALLIADEPTTALDVRVQKNILQLLKELQQQNNMSILFITHDLQLVSDIADEILVMYKGEIVESGNAKQILTYPQHQYTKALLACLPTPDKKGKKLTVISDTALSTNEQAIEQNEIKISSNEAVLDIKNLIVKYPIKTNFFGKATAYYNAVDDVSFSVFKNEIVGLVGESGCGKTTLGKTILNLIKPTSGQILFEGKNVANLSSKEKRLLSKELQIIFQDPYGSLNPRISIGNAIAEPLKVHKLYGSKNAQKEKAIELLEQVNMPADAFNRYPHQFSGGQRQRICIARALALNPRFLIFDESVSALDVSVQAQVLNLINELKARYNFTAIFITHNFPVVHYISDRILVMKNGKIVEEGLANDVIFSPKQDYTKELLAAVPGNKFIL